MVVAPLNNLRRGENAAEGVEELRMRFCFVQVSRNIQGLQPKKVIDGGGGGGGDIHKHKKEGEHPRNADIHK